MITSISWELVVPLSHRVWAIQQATWSSCLSAAACGTALVYMECSRPEPAHQQLWLPCRLPLRVQLRF